MTADPRRRTVASEPYRWPFAGDLTGERLAVVVTGASPWFARRCWSWESTAATISAVASAARPVGGLIVWTSHSGSARHLPAPGHADSRICLDMGPHDVVVDAGGLDGFYAGRLDQVLRSRRRDLVVLAGAGFETTVHSTLRSANDRGFECITLADAAAAHTPALAGACASTIRMSGGIFGAVGHAADLISSLTALEQLPCLFPS